VAYLKDIEVRLGFVTLKIQGVKKQPAFLRRWCEGRDLSPFVQAGLKSKTYVPILFFKFD